MGSLIEETLGDIPLTAVGQFIELIRSVGLDEAFKKFEAGEVADFNTDLTANAAQLGPIKPTTTLAANQFQNAKTTAAGLSNQATTDVNRRFDQTGAAGQASLASRGLGGSTLGSSLAYANERNRSDELRRVNDDRINTLLGVEETFGGREIDANEFAQEQERLAINDRIMVAPGGPNRVFTPSTVSRG